MSHASGICALVSLSALAVFGGTAFAAPTLTGHANLDFNVPGAVSVADDSIGRDVGLPLTAPIGTVSGWDLSWLRLFYDPATDVLYVGLQTYGIGGDADGDGDEGTTSTWLSGLFGADLPQWDDTESFALMLDTNDDGTFDVIAGVPATGDVTTYTVAEFSGLTSLPGFAFGATLDGHVPADPVVGPASFAAPHIEFRISGFSQLPGFDGTVGRFRAKAFMGSLEDAGIGEDRLPNGNDMAAVICLDADQDGYTTCDGDCDDSSAAASPGNLGDPLCDQVDEDCDGKLDEDFGGPGVPTSCGLDPICQATGFLICVDGQVTDTCVPGDNGVFQPEPTSCGVGACAATGTTTCATGVVSDTCTPGTPADVDTCNGIDDDCDGSTDEGFVAEDTSCGTGVCLRMGVTTCVDGVVGDTCAPGDPAPFEVCNGLDDDCNGATDDAPALPPAPTCGLGECATTGTISCINGEEVGECTPPQGTPELCDGLDNDCNGAIDDSPALPEAPTCGVGECATTGTVDCVDGSVVSECTPPAGEAETCDGLDNDCNGATDDGIAPAPTSCGTGACASTGTLSCTEGTLVDSCAPGSPSAEVCDGVDNDCNGSTDEGIDPTPTSCGTGSCAATGVLACTDGELVDSCSAGAPTGEVCDGLDNDCNGATDDGIAPTPTSCGVGSCAATGSRFCQSGALVDTCSPGSPSSEVCDGADNDCNGLTDDGIDPAPTSCGTGACASTGVLTCTDGELVDSCAPGSGSSEVCDGVDNDCNGATDDGIAPTPTSCGSGACSATGELVCQDGQLVDTCAAAPGTPEVCNGVDDNCNGAVDEDTTGIYYTVTQGGQTFQIAPLAGTSDVTTFYGYDVPNELSSNTGLEASNRSVFGLYRDPNGVMSLLIIHDAVEDGSGGQFDMTLAGLTSGTLAVEDDPSGAPDAFGDPNGAYSWKWPQCCTDGAAIEDIGNAPCFTVTPGAMSGITGIDVLTGGAGGERVALDTQAAPFEICATVCCEADGGTDADCDGVDNDCDGETDESFVGDASSCGTGACAATGQIVCVNGEVVDTCTAGSATGGDANCDSTDDDCDGSTDESFVGEATTCGEGACTATGVTSCVDGTVVDSCAASQPGMHDGCDGADNDCDGATDEDFVPDPTTCGVSICSAMGMTTCVDGVVGDSCTPGTPGLGDPFCDGVDEDCDGQTDEDFGGLGIGTTCGSGECASEGMIACIDGQIIDTCTPGPITGDDADCDLVDNDCDSSTDESFVGEPTSCGTGACAGSGITACNAGVVSDSCVPGSATGDDSDCDGVDDDCDGSTDESFVGAPTSCGAGVCASTGTTVCVAGVIGDTCAPGTATGGDADCDATDNDCDGSTDESFVGEPTSCGTGVCAATGTTTCSAGVIGDTCAPGTATGGDDDCDATDNDCDGSTDESFVGTPTSCGTGVCAASGVTTCAGGVISDTCTPGASTGRDATCDNRDNDCDGSTDEAFAPVPTSCGTGVCAANGQTTCADGVVGDTCTPGTATGGDADCDATDNDCDGSTDESFVGEPTACGTGVCASTGSTSCVGGVIGDSCVPGTAGGDDSVCDGVDDDCDGSTDESFVGESTTCGEGACTGTGATSCVDGTVVDSCSAGQPGMHDGCDGVDNDCDGATDEDFVPDPTTCGVSICSSMGMTTCVDGVIGDSCTPGTPGLGDPYCDGVDEDCDGQTDEDFGGLGIGTTCGAGECASEGLVVCIDGQIVDTCTPGPVTGDDDDCDLLDNDCDGATDESFMGEPTSCGVGACAGSGTTACNDGVISDSCVPGTATGDDADCDGVDNDCDGATDESFVSEPTSCGTGVCAANGMTTCSAGVVGDTCTPGTATGGDDDCDSTDNDCDGATDESFVSEPTSCGTGVCASSGVTTCSAGVIGDTCLPTSPTGGDTDCDSTDNDCDGATDESFVSEPTSCGTGVCAANGMTTCSAGVVSDTCTPGTATGGDDDCDSTDNDCDGATDESFVSEPTSCGTGVCAANGMTSCSDGVVSDTCTPGTATGGDDDCDSTDNDCDGATDESFVSEPTSCGTGVCAANGMTTCSAGVVSDTCTPGTATGGDDDCDSTDDDCDGATDESFVSEPTSCGSGACASSGMTTCEGGVVGDTCVPGGSGGDDSTCDGVDDDCDGSTDESFVGTETNCGSGVCAARGVTTCEGGVIGDTCVPGGPGGDDSTCDGVDDDCDGSTDESFVGTETNCGAGVCAARGVTTCSGGVVGDTCAPGEPGGDDSNCDSVDDDCDGSTDESFVGIMLPCGEGACASTSQVVCVDGGTIDTCRPGSPTGNDWDCNGVDDDCDGATDEGFRSEPTTCGEGVCHGRGHTTCDGGVIGDSCREGRPLGPDANCDSVDDDCDGATDEAFVGIMLPCGEGACTSISQVVCVDGGTIDTCRPGSPTGNDWDCNGVDDDCDGATDEGFRPEPTTCGEGVCHGRGHTTCNGGVIGDSCRVGAPVGPDKNCDSVDDDCDGATDESFVGIMLPCGAGACVNISQVMCVDGATVDTCEPGSPSGDDLDCDGDDNDCDGATDEGFRPEPTTCGVGACESRGKTYCAAGDIHDTCQPGWARPTDTTCDGIDDDCDGSVDESFRPQPTTCGEGECYSRGMTRCEGGVRTDTCRAGEPTAEICEDGLDQDCDGEVDNGCECSPPAPGAVFAVGSAHSDECHGGSDMQSIALAGFFDGDSSHVAQFAFNDDALFEWSEDGLSARIGGSATLQGITGNGAGPIGSSWWVEVLVSYRGTGLLGEGNGGPNAEMASCQPMSVTDTWEYFDMIEGEAIISKMGSPADYAVLSVFPAGGVFPLQVGLAANNRNGGMGLWAGVEFIHFQQRSAATRSTGEITLDLDCP
ncbi:MAG: hypothetical protein H6744_10015 [Deltaproteobacteria bacterium]|nr:hypothetical protein [Deltaproteobacteria bacterium]